MPFITKNVNKAQVKFNESFVYTINGSFNGITGEISSGQIVDVIPSYLDYVLPPITAPIQDIFTEDVADGTKITFDLGRIEDTGVAIVINFSASFKTGSVPGDFVYSNTADLLVNGEVELTSPPADVKVVVESDWSLTKKVLAPESDPTAGESAYYLIELKNEGDAGVAFNGVITDTLPEGVTIDQSYTPKGEDWSIRDSSNNQNGVVTDNTVKWTLNNYKGTYYAMIFKVSIAENFTVGDTIENTVSWEIDGVGQPDFTLESQIVDTVYDATVLKGGPKCSKPGALIAYEVYADNKGNNKLTEVVLIDNIPDEVFVKEVFPGNFGITRTGYAPPLQYTLSYSIDGGESYQLINTFSYNGNVYLQFIDLTALTDEKITNLKWEFPEFDIGLVPFHSPLINGIVDAETKAQFTINEASLIAKELRNPVGKTVVTSLNGVSCVKGTKTNIPNGSVFPSSIIRYQADFDGRYSRIENPVICDLLPAEVEYVGNIKCSYKEYFEGFSSYNSDDNPEYFPEPTVEIVPDFDSTGRELLRIVYNPFLINQKSLFTVSFDVRVKPGAIGEFSNTFILGSFGETYVENGLRDSLDYDGDLILDEKLLQTNSVQNRVLFQTSIASDKKVKGSLDTEFTEEPEVGETIEGGSADYKITLTNTGNSIVNEFEIIDILPHIGDTGVILANQQRQSEFPVFLGSSIEVSLTPQLPDDPTPQISLEYSNSYDPVRFDQSGTATMGTDNDWSSSPPINITDGKSIRIKSVDTPIKPGQSIIINIEGIVPLGTAAGNIAWNTFAMKSTFVNPDGEIEDFLPVEPEKVGIMIKEAPKGKVKLGDFVWYDSNRNGLYEPQLGETGANGVLVELYAPNGNTLLQSTVTANDTSGNPGFYLFNNIDPGVYRIKFVAPEGFEITTQNPNGSKPDSVTGFTPVITSVTQKGSEDLTIDAGIFQTPKTATVGDTVWFDENRNGIIDGDERGVSNVNISLYKCGTTSPIRYSAITDNDGKYLIRDVEIGEYYAVFTNIPSEYEFVTAGGYVDNNGKSSCFKLRAGDEKLDVDAPIAAKYGKVEGYVWCDYNANGVKEERENGLENIVVTLYSCTNPAKSYTVFTNEYGYYCVPDVEAGLYRVAFSNLPPDMEFLTAGGHITLNGVTPECVSVRPTKTVIVNAPVDCCAEKCCCVCPRCCHESDFVKTANHCEQIICPHGYAKFGKEIASSGYSISYDCCRGFMLVPQGMYLISYSGEFVLGDKMDNDVKLEFTIDSKTVSGSTIIPLEPTCGVSHFCGTTIVNSSCCDYSEVNLVSVGKCKAIIKNLAVSIVRIF